MLWRSQCEDARIVWLGQAKLLPVGQFLFHSFVSENSNIWQRKSVMRIFMQSQRERSFENCSSESSLLTDFKV